jgi:formate dehydrogenase alpha subunit
VAGLVTSLGSGAMTNPITDLTLSDCILVIGSNFAENHPIISRYVLDAKERGATLIVADPRFTPTAWQADIFLQLLPGTDISLLNGLMNIILSEGIQKQDFIATRTNGFKDLVKGLKEYTPERVARETGVDVDNLIAAAHAYATAGAASIVYCMGVTQHTCGTDTVIDCANLALMCGQIGRPGTGVNPLRGQDNVQGACDMGALVNVFPGYQSVADEAVRAFFAKAWGTTPDLLPAKPGKTVVEMSHAAVKGELKGMLIMGENPVVGDPNSSHVQEGLEALDFLAVIDLFMTETARMADVILPAAGFAEKRGSKTATDRRVQWFERAIDPIGECKPDWRIVSDLATDLGFGNNFKYESEEQILAEIQSVTPIYQGISAERIQNTLGGIPWPCRSVDSPGTPILYTETFSKPDGRAVFKPIEQIPSAEERSDDYPLFLTSGRVVIHYNTGTMTRRSRALRHREPELFLQIHPATCESYGIRDLDQVEVATRRGRIRAKARVTKNIPQEVVFLPFHFPDTNLLTTDALDPVAKIPEYKVAACRIARLSSDQDGAD